MYDLNLKLKAQRLYIKDGLSVPEIHEILVEEDDFPGTMATIRYWVKQAQEGQPFSVAQDDEFELDESDIEDGDPSTGELVDELNKLRRKCQRLMDHNRVLRKTLREGDRVLGTAEQLLESLLDKIPSHPPVKFTPVATHTVRSKTTMAAVVQLSDLHLNESVLLSDTKGKNEYNFKVASRRLQKYADRIRMLLMPLCIRHIVLALTGDMFNSNRRKDEMLRNMHALTEGFLYGSDLISQFILDLAQNFEIEVISVFGNESRMDEEIQSIDFHNNFDFLLHHYLSKVLSKQENVIFHQAVTDHELLTEINGANVLFWHGHNRISIDRQILKYNKMNKVVHFVIAGHRHHLHLKEEFGQSSSLVGDNAYNFHRLGMVARASQNIYIIENNGGPRPAIMPVPIDLQYANDYPGYPVPEKALNYGMASESGKYDGQTTILKIVI